MNDQFVGDVGDFTKFALLRATSAAASRLALESTWAVLWWATVAPTGVDGDGGHTSYVDQRLYADADGELVQSLRGLLKEQRRSIQALEASSLLPGAVHYHREAIDGAEPLRPKSRAAWRSEWLRGVRAVAEKANFVFVDPDNGLAPRSSRPTQAEARRHVFLDEITTLVRPEQTLILYHHATRAGTRPQQARELQAKLAAGFQLHRPPRVYCARRYSVRFYAVIPARRHDAVFDALERRLGSGPWPLLLQREC